MSFAKSNPIIVAVYLLTVAGIAACSLNLGILCISLGGGLLFDVLRNGRNGWRNRLLLFAVFGITALLNPIFSHNGATVLFVVNHTPVTLEAFLYGLAAAGALAAVLTWFFALTRILTADKLLYLFGKLSPKTALLLSMGLRYVPLFGRQAGKINRTQTALGLYKEDNLIDRTKGGLRVFSVLLTWGLETGIVTADSMAARGYGIGRRSHFSRFRFRRRDGCLLALTLLLGGFAVAALATGALDCRFYPTFSMPPLTPMSAMGYLAYGLLASLPIFTETEELIKWKYLRSRI